MPAKRATSKGPPFLSRPARTRRIAGGAIRIRPRATASRDVTGLSDTSTMRARPPRSMCVRAGPGGPAAGLPTLEWRTIVLLQVAREQKGHGVLAGLGLGP